MATQVLGQSGGNSLFPGSSNIGMALSNDMYDLQDLSKAELAAPQLIMLANVALTGEVSGNCCDYLVGEERQMAELTTVGDSNFSDSDGEGMEDTQAAESDREAPENVELSSVEVPGVETQGPAACSPPKTRSVDKDGSLEAPSTPESTEDKCKSLKSKPFRCKPCQYEAESEEEFVHHIRVHSAKKFFVEENAEKQAQVKESDSCTAEEVDFSKGPIRCDRCGYNTNRYDHYLAHLKHHNKAGENERVYKCTICTYTTVSEYHWKKHLRNHFPRKVYTCSECSYFSDRKNNYIQHIRTHTGERPYQCTMCPYSSSQKTHLTRHMRTHSGEKPFKCDQCSYVASNQHEVTRHARQVHNGPKPLICPHCNYKTADRSNFKKHVELHINPRQFLCPVCDYAASKKCNLQYHIKSRHPDCSDITMDVSKVKLRTKKSEADFSESGNDKVGKEPTKGDSASKKTEKIVKVEKKDNSAKEKKSASNVSASQVTTRSRKLASENKNVDIKTEKSTEKTCKTKKVKRKAETEATSSKQEPANDTSVVTKKKKKVEAKPRDYQEAQKSDIATEEEPRKQNFCLKKNRKKQALKIKHSKKSSKLDQEKIEEEEMPDEYPITEEDGSVKLDTEGSDQKEQDPTDTVALSNNGGHALSGGSTDPKGNCIQGPGQLCLPAQDANTEGEVEDQEMPAGAGESEDTGDAKEKRQADKKEDSCSLESSQAASSEESLDVLMNVVPDLAPENEADETVAETETNSNLMDLTKTCPPATESAADAVPAPVPPEGHTQSPKVALSLSRDNTAVNESQEMDEDEGIHSHEGSDISDNISEGSDDSGLNGARSVQEETSPKMLQEAPDTTVARENYVCIFCDRSFKKESEYSKHLNRHLVNVYYLEKAAKGQE
ncbi:PREDICTED: RE1-silencing transcription factor [Sturnus vulgaris]|uniref:RE1-silencing transcription factor n=1 Tax=Sturnus vulgaris TaxID=9172 RepID=UPI00071A9A2F|nr:PREDICTED: RE1-silencing transcription factor [Sturnus vulgaris]XP_014743767.1 PREDICTED: RE1-silencing transcription factor [Sturnus vulgaris]